MLCIGSLCLGEFGILLVAVSCPRAHGGKFRINPGNRFVLQQGHVGFFIAQGPNQVRRHVTDDADDDDDDDDDDENYDKFVVVVVNVLSCSVVVVVFVHRS